MKQVDLAKKLDISTSFLSEIEAGKKVPSVELLEAYATLFGVPTSTFFLFQEQVATPVDAKKRSRALRLMQFFAWVVEDDIDHEEGSEEKTDGRD